MLATYMRNLVAGFVAVALCTVLLGLAYPASVWAISRVTTSSAEGHLVKDGQCVVASELLDDARAESNPDLWFHGRAEGMSNLGPSSPELAASIEQRHAEIAAREGVSQVPTDAVTGSGSGVDAGISPEYAATQVPRVARAHGLSEAEVSQLVADATSSRALGVLGETTVNITKLNLSLPHGSRCK